MSDENTASAWLIDEAGNRTEIARNITVGRAPANSLVIQDPEHRVSQYHARLEQDTLGRVFVEDRHSTNGTYINEIKIVRQRLADGDRIRFGSRAVYIFHCEGKQRDSTGSMDRTMMGATARDYEERECWFVIGDVKGSSQLVTELGNNAFARMVTDWAASCMEIAGKNGGIMANRTGDGWLLLWTANEGSAERVGAAIRGLQALQRQANPGFRVCVHRGRATMGASVRPGEENVLSAELHQAFRMEKIAARLAQNVVVSEVAAAELRSVIPCEALPGEFELNGFTGLHRFYRIS